MSDNPFVKPITDARLVAPARKLGGGIDIVLLDRVEPGVTPEYCIHGKTSCVMCGEWCWLGDKTHDLLVTGQAAGICIPCAAVPRDHPRRHIHDHRRADGPHT